MIKVRGKWKWCWNLIDRDTRFLIACQVTSEKYIKDARKVFKKAKKIVPEKPKYIITDGLQTYKKAIKKEYASWRIPRVTHIGNAGISKKINNNMIERYHNDFRNRDKVMRGFHSMKTSQNFSNNFRFFHNFIRPHMTLGGLTPAQAAGLNVGFERNRWLEILRLSMDGNKLPTKPKNLSGYVMRVWDHDGKELSKFHMRKFKTDFDDMKKAMEFLMSYEEMFPELVLFIEKKYR